MDREIVSKLRDELGKHHAISQEDLVDILRDWVKNNLCPKCGHKIHHGFGGSISCPECRYWAYQ